MELTSGQLDVLTELINIGVGRAAAVLNEMLDSHIVLSVPSIKPLDADLGTLFSDFGNERLSTVQMKFKGSFAGNTLLLIPAESASKLVSSLTEYEEESGEDLDAVRSGTLMEVGNIVINSVLGSIGNILEEHLTYTIPYYQEDTAERVVDASLSEKGFAGMLVRTKFSVSELEVEGDFVFLFEVESFESLLDTLTELDDDASIAA